MECSCSFEISLFLFLEGGGSILSNLVPPLISCTGAAFLPFQMLREGSVCCLGFLQNLSVYGQSHSFRSDSGEFYRVSPDSRSCTPPTSFWFPPHSPLVAFCKGIYERWSFGVLLRSVIYGPCLGSGWGIVEGHVGWNLTCICVLASSTWRLESCVSKQMRGGFRNLLVSSLLSNSCLIPPSLLVITVLTLVAEPFDLSGCKILLYGL